MVSVDCCEYNIICRFVEADGFSSDGFYWNDLTNDCLRSHYNKHQNKKRTMTSDLFKDIIFYYFTIAVQPSLYIIFNIKFGHKEFRMSLHHGFNINSNICMILINSKQ